MKRRPNRRKLPTGFTLLPELIAALDIIRQAGLYGSNSEAVADLIKHEWERRWPGREFPKLIVPAPELPRPELNDAPRSEGPSNGSKHDNPPSRRKAK